MNTVLVTQRVEVARTGERRDALDQAWAAWLGRLDCLAVPVPNRIETALGLFDQTEPAGLLLTGGNDLAEVGGNAPERDGVELALVERALEAGVPIIGVCRGFQLLVLRDGGELREIEGHVATHHRVRSERGERRVNSFHRFGISRLPNGWVATDHGEDGSVEGARRRTGRVRGLLWHPERVDPFAREDLERFAEWFAPEQQR